MTRLLAAAIVAIAIIGEETSMANPGPIILLDSIAGTSFLAIQSAMPVLERHRPDLERTNLEVVRNGTSAVVVLAEAGRQGPSRGKFGVRTDSNTELNADDLRTITSDAAAALMLDKIQGSSFLAIRAAMKAFQVHNPDLAQYRIEVVREGDVVSVLFADKDRADGTRGSVGQSGFEVDLNPRDWSVVRSHFVR